MIYNYCTLFDSFFLSRGLALYHSLKRTTPNFRLYVFPFDQKALEVLRDMELPDVTVVSQAEFETPELLKIKTVRTRGEYCWTCTPVIIDYCIKEFNLSQCTYLDADLYFFSNANQLVAEMGDRSALITDHRYTTRYDQSKTSGKYCVQFMTFKNSNAGMTILSWWKEKCLEWCFDRFEDGKFGDQKYLDDWTQRFDGVYDLPNEGAGLAPWNIQQYDIRKKGESLIAVSKATEIEWPVVFYHFHGLKFLKNKIDLGAFRLAKVVVDCIYKPYLYELNMLNKNLLSKYHVSLPIQGYATKSGVPIPIHKVLRRFLGVYNLYSNKDLSS